jgi:hypothetical protein
VFSAYHKAGAVALLKVLGKAIEAALGGRRLIRTDMPTAGRATLRVQGGRDVLHLLYANPIRRGTLRGDAVQPIQDIVPLHDVTVEVEAEGVRAVRLVPEGGDLPFEASEAACGSPSSRGGAPDGGAGPGLRRSGPG